MVETLAHFFLCSGCAGGLACELLQDRQHCFEADDSRCEEWTADPYEFGGTRWSDWNVFFVNTRWNLSSA